MKEDNPWKRRIRSSYQVEVYRDGEWHKVWAFQTSMEAAQEVKRLQELGMKARYHMMTFVQILEK